MAKKRTKRPTRSKKATAPEPVSSAVPGLERVSSSVPGLDVLLQGGLVARRGYLIKGPPGSGKTILASQYCFDAAHAGKTAVFVTLLSESHATLLENLRTLTFFDEALVPDRVTFVSAHQPLLSTGLSGLSRVLRGVLRRAQPAILVIDSISAIIEQAPSTEEARKFFRALVTFAAAAGTTCLFVLLEADSHAGALLEPVLDGTIELERELVGQRSIRLVEITRLRGSAHLDGQHTFDITRTGLAIHPRTEARVRRTELIPGAFARRIPFGVPKLDAMLCGGLGEGSSTAIHGAPGVGKTVLGLHFLTEGARRDEPGLYFGFFESPPRLIAKAAGVGLELGRWAERGLIELSWRVPVEQSMDAMAEELLAQVDARRVSRLFIDGMDGFRSAASFPDRLNGFFAALTQELRARGVTLLVSKESTPFSPQGEVDEHQLSAIFENLLLLRYVELRSHLYRLLSILKMRDSAYDSSIREFRITGRGFELASSFQSAEAILSGFARSIEPSGRRTTRTKRSGS